MNMGLVSVPNLDYGSALAFCREFETYKWDEENIFDFTKVYNCDPFPMLCVGSKIRKEELNIVNWLVRPKTYIMIMPQICDSIDLLESIREDS